MSGVFNSLNGSFGFKIAYITKYVEAKNLLQSEISHYDLVILIGERGAFEIIDIEDLILNSDQKLIKIFISKSRFLVDRASEMSFSLSFLIGKNENFYSDSEPAKSIREYLINSGKISSQISINDIKDPICIFRQQIASEMSEKNLFSITTILNAEEISYAIEKDNNEGIIVDSKQLVSIKRLVLRSDLKFWKKWLQKEIQGSAIPLVAE